MGEPLASDSDRRLSRLSIALVITCLLGWVFKAHCQAGGWRDAIQYRTGCYSDVVPFWFNHGVAAGELPYFEARLEYPVLTGLQIWIEGLFARLAFGPSAGSSHFLMAVTLANGLIAWAVLRALFHAGVEDRRLWLWALAPPLILYLGHNWDMGAVGLAVAAMLLAHRNRLVAAAAVAALGAAAKLFPALILPLIGLAALFEPGKGWRARILRAAACTSAAIGAWAAVNAPVALFAWDNWLEFYRFSQERSGTAAASWDVLAAMGWWFTWVAQRNLYAPLLFLGGAAAIVGIGWRRHGAQPWVLFAPVLAWFLLTNKVWSPQFDLWLYPVLVMVAPRLWPIGLFVLGDIAAYFAEFWWFAGNEGAWPAASYGHIAAAWAFRAAAMLLLIVDCVRLPAPGWTRA